MGCRVTLEKVDRIRRQGQGVPRAPVGLAPAVGCDAILGRDRVVDPAVSDRPEPCRGLILESHVAVWDAMLTARLGLETAGPRPHGACRLQQMVDRLGITGWLTSLRHCGDLAMASIIALSE